MWIHPLTSLAGMLLLLSAPVRAQVLAGAAPTPPEAPDRDIILSLRGLGEIWQDPHISSLYRSSRFSGGLHLSWQFHNWLSADLEMSTLRMLNDDGSRLELSPLSLNAAARKEIGRAEVSAGLGPALVPFSEAGSNSSYTPGTKLGLDVRAGLRLATGLYDPPAYPASVIERVDLEIFVGRRQHFGPTSTQLPADLEGYVGPGRLDLSAWRVGVGLGVRL